MKNRFLTLLALSLTLGLLMTLPAMASEAVAEGDMLESQMMEAPVAEKAVENTLEGTDIKPQVIEETGAGAPLTQAPEWLQTSILLVGELQNGCFPPSPPPPSCECSVCCECNKCWQNGQLVKMPCGP